MKQSRIFHPFCKYELDPLIMSPKTIILIIISIVKMIEMARLTWLSKEFNELFGSLKGYSRIMHIAEPITVANIVISNILFATIFLKNTLKQFSGLKMMRLLPCKIYF